MLKPTFFLYYDMGFSQLYILSYNIYKNALLIKKKDIKKIKYDILLKLKETELLMYIFYELFSSQIFYPDSLWIGNCLNLNWILPLLLNDGQVYLG